jgi:hypothetical protein
VLDGDNWDFAVCRLLGIQMPIAAVPLFESCLSPIAPDAVIDDRF